MINHNLARQMILSGYTDAETANTCKCKRTSITKLRLCKLKLPVNKVATKKDRINRNYVIKLVDQGKTDREIAKILNTNSYYICKIRKQELQLPRRDHSNSCYCKTDRWIPFEDIKIVKGRFLCPKCGKSIGLGTNNATKNKMSADQKIKLILEAKQELPA